MRANSADNTHFSAHLKCMSEDDIETLIRRLQDLQTEERCFTELIRQAASSRQQGQSNRGARAGRVSPPPAAPRQGPPPARGRYSVGQRVFIENRIRHVPFSRRANPSDRAATVQRVTEDRIYITTYNGYETWRHPSNIRSLSEQEHQNIVDGQRH